MSPSPPLRDGFRATDDVARQRRQWAALAQKLDGRGSLRERWLGDVVPGAPFYLRPAFAWSMAFALVLLVGVSALRPRPGPVAPIASQARELTLADGSRAQLATGATLDTVVNEPAHIDTTLRTGAARFDVVPNRARSFRVSAAGVEVWVIGTAFQVVLDGEQVTVSVEHGVVEVRGPRLHGQARRIEAGQSWSSASLPASTAPLASTAAGPSSPLASAVASADAPALPDANDPAPPPATRDDSPPGPATARPSTSSRSATAASATATDEARELFQSASQARRAGDTARAAALYQQFLQRYPGDPRAQLAALELGRLAMDRSSDATSAEEPLKKAGSGSVGSPGHEDALARLVDLYAARGDRAACAQAQARYLAAYPRGVHAARVRAACASP